MSALPFPKCRANAATNSLRCIWSPLKKKDNAFFCCCGADCTCERGTDDLIPTSLACAAAVRNRIKSFNDISRKEKPPPEKAEVFLSAGVVIRLK
jgi:hypothetical protein